WSFSLHVGVNQWDFSHLNLIVYQQRRPLRSTLFPYTTLFRSRNVGGAADRDGERAQKDQDHHRSGHHVPHGRPRQLPAGAASLGDGRTGWNLVEEDRDEPPSHPRTLPPPSARLDRKSVV